VWGGRLLCQKFEAWWGEASAPSSHAYVNLTGYDSCIWSFSVHGLRISIFTIEDSFSPELVTIVIDNTG